MVIAFGNPLREDDGVGWAVAKALRGRERDVVAFHQLLPELAAALHRARFVVFVDADRRGPAGEVRFERLVPRAEQTGRTHVLSPATLLGLCADCYGRVPEAAVVSIAGASFGFGAALSPQVRRAVPLAARRVRSLLVELGGRRH